MNFLRPRWRPEHTWLVQQHIVLTLHKHEVEDAAVDYDHRRPYRGFTVTVRAADRDRARAHLPLRVLLPGYEVAVSVVAYGVEFTQ